MEQRELFNSINFDFTRFEGIQTPRVENSTARLYRVGSFLCPSESQNESRNSYRYNLGLFRQAEGPFRLFLPSRPMEIRDGLHHTVFFSERFGGSFIKDAKDPIRDTAIHQPTSPLGSLGPDEVLNICRTSPIASWFHTTGRYWFYHGTHNTAYSHDAMPNDRETSCEIGWTPEGQGGLHGPRSYHSSGVNVLMGDGSVNFVSDSIEALIWRALGTSTAGD
jgi:prepilin-type processing-associated H-X9-DG protein